MGMNSGYSGWSRSKRAEQAEDEGKRPASRLVKALRPYFPGITAADVKAMMEPCEWHHTSKRANATDYYNSADVLPDHEDHECPDPGHDPKEHCDECENKTAANDLADDLREQIAKRIMLNRLIRKHGKDGLFKVMLDTGEVWHTVGLGEVRHLARVLQTVNHGSIHHGVVDLRAEEEELRKAGFRTD
jgi:hypothetical protein